MGEGMMVAGIGCRAGVSVTQVEAAIEAAIAELCARQRAEATMGRAQTRASSKAAAEVGVELAMEVSTAAGTSEHSGTIITAIATPAAKVNEAGIRAAAAARGVPLLAISQDALEAADSGTVTRSEHSMAAMNVHSV